MENDFEFSDSELDAFMKETRVNDIEKCIDSLIAFTRYKQAEYEQLNGNISGQEVLAKFHQDGLIQTKTYLKLRQLIDNPNADYTINITDGKETS